MRILYWTPFFLPDTGGIETFAAKFLPKLQQRNYDIIIVTSHGRHGLADETEYSGIPVFRFHTRNALGKRDLGLVIKIRQQIAKLKQSFKPDIIHIHISDPSVYFHLSTTTACQSPTLVTLHHDITTFRLNCGMDNTLLGQALAMADWVTAVSEATLSNILQLMPEIKEKSSVIYNGIDISNSIPEPLPFDTPCILCLGRLLYEKGFDLAITAFSTILNRFPRVRLKIVGEGPKCSELKQLAVSLSIADSIDFTGWIDPRKVTSFINQSTVVVMPSRFEGFPMVALEAAQMARPVVATPVGGLPEAVIDGRTGLLVEKENSLALAEAVTFLLNNPAIAIQMGKAARSRVLDIFSMENSLNSYDRLYRKLIEASPYAKITKNNKVERYPTIISKVVKKRRYR
jgi:glycogen(starch) synthase